MKSSVRFMDGSLLDATLFSETDDIVLNLTHSSKTVRNCLIINTPNGLEVFKIIRKMNYRHLGIRLLLNELSQNLEKYYNYSFKGISWGIPEISYEHPLRVFALNGTILFREDGFIYPAFSQALRQQNVDPPDIKNLLVFLDNFSRVTKID